MAVNTKRVDLDSAHYNQVQDLKVAGVTVRGSLSPFDVPRQVAASYDDQSKEYRIFLKYLTPDEPTTMTDLSKEIAVFLGQSSGKLYQILIRRQEPGTIRNLKLTVTNSVDDLVSRELRVGDPSSYLQHLNLLVAKKVFEENPELYSVA
jgi:hypothetical protein